MTARGRPLPVTKCLSLVSPRLVSYSILGSLTSALARKTKRRRSTAVLSSIVWTRVTRNRRKIALELPLSEQLTTTAYLLTKVARTDLIDDATNDDRSAFSSVLMKPKLLPLASLD